MSYKSIIIMHLVLCVTGLKAQFPAERVTPRLHFTPVQNSVDWWWSVNEVCKNKSNKTTQRCWIGFEFPKKSPGYSFMVHGFFKDTSVTKTVISRKIKNNRDSIFFEYPVCSMDSSNNVYVAWLGPQGLAFQHSSDTGHTWMPEEKIINPAKSGWLYPIDNIKMTGKPSIACDNSQGEHKGRVYICWSDEKYGRKDKDVFLIYSDDQGATWTEPILVSYRPNHKAQFAPYLFVDRRNGFVYIVYYDKQNYAEGKLTDVYLALSRNGGLKFDYFKVNAEGFRLTECLNHDDYNFLRVYDGVVPEITWYQNKSHGKLVYYRAALTDSAYIFYKNAAMQDALPEIAKTLVYAEKLEIPFQLASDTKITAVITKPLEPDFEKPVFKNKNFKKGSNKLIIDPGSLGLEKGNYTLFLYYNSTNKFIWITEE